jgi:hypothetical protein
MKVVGKYTNSFSANVVKGMLSEAGIDAFVLNENVGIITGAINEDLLSIELVVDDSNYDEALKLIEATSSAS